MVIKVTRCQALDPFKLISEFWVTKIILPCRVPSDFQQIKGRPGSLCESPVCNILAFRKEFQTIYIQLILEKSEHIGHHFLFRCVSV